MPYVDSDFFLALLKEGDWLSKKAEGILKKYKSNIWTSVWSVVEILMLTEEFGLDPENVVLSIKELSRIDGDVNSLLSAAHLMKEKKMKTFDALHATACKKDLIISSDSVFDKVGLERIRLEKGW